MELDKSMKVAVFVCCCSVVSCGSKDESVSPVEPSKEEAGIKYLLDDFQGDLSKGVEVSAMNSNYLEVNVRDYGVSFVSSPPLMINKVNTPREFNVFFKGGETYNFSGISKKTGKPSSVMKMYTSESGQIYMLHDANFDGINDRLDIGKESLKLQTWIVDKDGKPLRKLDIKKLSPKKN